MLATIILILLTAFVESLLVNLEDPSETYQQCLTSIANKYLADKTTVIVDLEPTMGLKNLNNPRIGFAGSNFNTLDSIKNKINNYILNYSDLDQLNETLAELRIQRKSWNSRGSFLVTTTNKITVQEAENVLKLLWDYNVYNSVMMGRNNKTMGLFSYDFIKSRCGMKITAEKMATCEAGGLIEGSDLFEKKITNDLCNNPLRTIWVPARPYTIDYKLKKNPGIFISFIKLFGERSNSNIVFIDNPSRYAKEVDNTDDYAIIAEDLNNNVADICVSLLGLDYRKCVKLYDCTLAVLNERLFWILPKPSKRPFWKSLITPFTLNTWIALCVMLFFGTMTFWAISHLQDEHPTFRSTIRCAILAFRANLSESDNLDPNTFTFRMFFIIFSALGVIIDTYYQGKLYLFLCNPGFEKGIRTLDDILESGLPLIFRPGISILFLFIGEKSQRVFDTFIPSNLSIQEALYHAVRFKDHLTVTTGGEIFVNPHLRESFNTLEVYFFYSTFYLKRDQILLDRLNEVTQRTQESGFFNKWISDIELEYFKQPLVDDVEGAFKLTLNHLQGVFVILGVGVLLASIAFALENLIARKLST